MNPIDTMSSPGKGLDLSSPMTFGVAAPGEALTSSESSAASPGAVESPVGLIPTQSLPRVPECPVDSAKADLQLGDVEGSPEIPTTKCRSQITGGRVMMIGLWRTGR